MNGNEYVDWETFREHCDEAKEDIARLGQVEEELMGNEVTGRASLRQEFIIGIQKEGRKNRITMISLGAALITALVLQWLSINQIYFEILQKISKP